MEKIIITIPAAGLADGTAAIKVEAEGFKGDGCALATGLFTKALGGVTNEELKSEYFEQADTQQLYEQE